MLLLRTILILSIAVVATGCKTYQGVSPKPEIRLLTVPPSPTTTEPLEDNEASSFLLPLPGHGLMAHMSPEEAEGCPCSMNIDYEALYASRQRNKAQ